MYFITTYWQYESGEADRSHGKGRQHKAYTIAKLIGVQVQTSAHRRIPPGSPARGRKRIALSQVSQVARVNELSPGSPDNVETSQTPKASQGLPDHTIKFCS